MVSEIRDHYEESISTLVSVYMSLIFTGGGIELFCSVLELSFLRGAGLLSVAEENCSHSIAF